DLVPNIYSYGYTCQFQMNKTSVYAVTRKDCKCIKFGRKKNTHTKTNKKLYTLRKTEFSRAWKVSSIHMCCSQTNQRVWHERFPFFFQELFGTNEDLFPPSREAAPRL
ncbi:unnamed protein product, partial [Coccothraustes coccothraustes]